MSQTLSYSHGAASTPLLGETIGANFRRTVERFPDHEALVVRAQSYRATYRQLGEAVEEAAHALLALGVQPGDRVGVWAPNRFEWVIVQYATARVGAILVNVNPSYQSTELEFVLNQAGVRFLFLARAFRSLDYLATLAEVRDRCPALEQSFVFEDGWRAFLALASRANVEDLNRREALLQFDDAINIQYTSGTTGSPKGATLSHHNILNNAYFVGLAQGFTAKDRLCIAVPFYHCFGMVLGTLACTAHGACMVVPGEAFDPFAVLETVQAERCTALYGVPTMFIAELDHPRFGEFDLSSLRTGVMAGAPCPIELMKKVVSLMHVPEIAIAYGMTETSPISTQSARDDSLERRVTTVGRVQPHLEIKIVDPVSLAVVPRGATGELCTRGYSVMLGYWNDEAATRASIDDAGWMHSGDLAVMDDAGYVNIVGRIKDMIIRGGENISPREIEEFLHTHPHVSEAQVIGVPSVKYGEEVMAWIRPKAGDSLCVADLQTFCVGKIARYKVPRYWKLCDRFPLTVTGKVQKYRMREIAVEELGLKQAAATRMA